MQKLDDQTSDLSPVNDSVFRLLVQSLTDVAVFLLDAKGYIRSWNPGAEAIKGYRAAEILGKHHSLFYLREDTLRGKPQTGIATATRDTTWRDEGWRIRKDGTRFWAEVTITVLKDTDGQIQGFAKVTRDLTEQKAMEAQLRQSQKMEAVGQLAGGIAHDFNNLVTVINGYCDLGLMRITSEDSLRQNLEAIRRAGTQASELTRQLLAFSRRQILQPRVLNINDIVISVHEMLHRLIGEHIAIELRLAPEIGKINADNAQIEQVIINLAVNARDAMTNGGTLVIETANSLLDEAYAKLHHDVTPGSYVMLAVSDTGSGMDEETQKHIFEPFFTTKAVGQGTGLGLATVYGVMKQSGGHIWVYSELGQGTTIKIYLPSVEAEVAPIELSDNVRQELGGSETILLVEDDEMVRNLTQSMLRWHGYEVLVATNGDQAVALCQQTTKPIHLVLTDVVMPGTNGALIANQVTLAWPDVRVLFMSGYTANVIVHHGVLDEGIELLEKPFTLEQLARKVRDVLDKQKIPVRPTA